MATDADALAIHATAVAIDGAGLVIRGASRAGKSMLALDLIARSTPACPIVLIGDDRILLRRAGAAILASPHPRIAGLIEKRGSGILATAYCTNVPVRLIVDLPSSPVAAEASTPSCDLLGENFPQLTLVQGNGWADRAPRVLAWFATLSAQRSGKPFSRRSHM